MHVKHVAFALAAASVLLAASPLPAQMTEPSASPSTVSARPMPGTPAQQRDLTGYWQDDQGGQYQVRHVGDELCWVMNWQPRAVNVFCGRVAENLILGKWMDVPGGELQNTGSLALRIESGDRMVKIGSSSAYGGSVWTRRAGAGAATGTYGLGSTWRVTGSAGWAAVWTRRGSTNVFDGVWVNADGRRVTAVYVITLEGNRILARRTASSDGNLCEYTGTLEADGITVSGTQTCRLISGTWPWRATIQ